MNFRRGDLIAVDVCGWYQTIGIILDDEPELRPYGFSVFDLMKQSKFFVLEKNAKKIA
jgi:hypothetical protein